MFQTPRSRDPPSTKHTQHQDGVTECSPFARANVFHGEKWVAEVDVRCLSNILCQVFQNSFV